MITALLIVIVLLLLSILAMMLIGWPGRERKEIAKTGGDLCRELAEHRAESVQLLHAMRIELEESVRETIEQEFASFDMVNRRASRQKKSSAPQQGSASKGEEEGSEGGEGIDEHSMKRSRSSRFQLSESKRQLPLFQEKKQLEETEYITSQVFLDDDLPDIEENLIG